MIRIHFMLRVLPIAILAAVFTFSCTLGTTPSPDGGDIIGGDEVLSNGEIRVNRDSPARPVHLVPSGPEELDTSTPSELPMSRVDLEPKAKVLILLYHNLTTSTMPGEYERNITDFENDLKYLRDNNIKTISLEDILKIQNGQLSFPPEQRLAVIMFDDGYISMYTRAFPLLKQYGMKATFAIITSFVGLPTNIPDGEPGRLTWTQIKTMARYHSATGERLFYFASHTVDHRSLNFNDTMGGSYPLPYAVDDENGYKIFLNMELNQSRKEIQSRIDQKIMFLALPYGKGTPLGTPDDIRSWPFIRDAAIRMKYSGIRTSDYGIEFGAFNAKNTEWNYHMPSLGIYGDTDITILPRYYDWEHLY
ncbi:MAG: polysaccharide deacetylase family protein [Spirochaetales bacterium]|nr:polysaccharide deacetylase family protein [Spirochaetales bacterium]